MRVFSLQVAGAGRVVVKPGVGRNGRVILRTSQGNLLVCFLGAKTGAGVYTVVTQWAGGLAGYGGYLVKSGRLHICDPGHSDGLAQ